MNGNRQIVSMQVSELDFDRKNPRLVEFDIDENSTDQDIIMVLWDTMDVRELVMSISSAGFFSHEPVIITEEHGKKIVIEGNRRLAAVKIMLDPTILGDKANAIQGIIPSDIQDLRSIPTICDTRKNIWHYLGFKHVNGPAKWSSYAKAKYIAYVHKDFGIPLKEIAKQIGDTHKTVQRLYRGLMVLEEAEKYEVFDREDRWHRHFSFSHIYTGLDKKGISSYIGLISEDAESENPVPPDKLEELGELLLWLYGSKKRKLQPLLEKQNPHLSQLDAILKDNEALAALKYIENIEIAFEVSRPSSSVLSESLYASKRSLQRAYQMIPTGYHGSQELLKTSRDIVDLANEIHNAMYRRIEANAFESEGE